MALNVTSGAKNDDCRRGWDMMSLSVRGHPQFESLSSSRPLQTAMRVCSACQYTCQKSRSDACGHLHNIRP